MEYQLGMDADGVIDESYVTRIDSDGKVSHIPNNPANKDWIEYQKSLENDPE